MHFRGDLPDTPMVSWAEFWEDPLSYRPSFKGITGYPLPDRLADFFSPWLFICLLVLLALGFPILMARRDRAKRVRILDLLNENWPLERRRDRQKSCV